MRIFAVVVVLLAVASGAAERPRVEGSSLDEVARGFASPPADSRIMMRWWWFGPSVSRTEIAAELRQMKDGGIGGV